MIKQFDCLMSALDIRLFLLVCLIGMFMGCKPSDEAAIRETHRAFVEAWERRDGAAAADLVGSRTLAFYGDLLDQVRSADSAALLSRDFITGTYIILKTRELASPERIASFDPKSYYDFLVSSDPSQDAIRQDYLALKLKEVVVEGAHASGSISVLDMQSGQQFLFSREGASWKIEPISLLEMVEKIIRMNMERTERSAYEVLREMVWKLPERPSVSDLFKLPVQ